MKLITKDGLLSQYKEDRELFCKNKLDKREQKEAEFERKCVKQANSPKIIKRINKAIIKAYVHGHNAAEIDFGTRLDRWFIPARTLRIISNALNENGFENTKLSIWGSNRILFVPLNQEMPDIRR